MSEAAASEKTGRDCYIGVPDAFRLDQACAFVNKAFDGHCYLVGSATLRTTYRDVDVRLILGDAAFDALFGMGPSAHLNPFWQLICTSVSLYLKETTGLPVDFQIQSMSEANGGNHAGRRHPLGMYASDPQPKWRRLSWVKRAPWSTWQAKQAPAAQPAV